MIKQITKDELQLLIRARGSLKIVDVLPREHYEKGHLPNALSLPLDEIEAKAQNILDKNDLIVVYCANHNCTASTKAAEKLISMGYKHVLDYKGGFAEYKENLPPCEHTVTAEQDRFTCCDGPCDDSSGLR